jgi:hypothetical protein
MTPIIKADENHYKRIDLHVHTPKSLCYEDHVTSIANFRTSPLEIVEAAISAGLDAIAITDHNTAEGIEEIKNAAKSLKLTVFPGIELSTEEGHVLAIFENDTPSNELRHLLRYLGFRKNQLGDAFYKASLPFSKVCDVVANHGGIAIAAHVDRNPSGFTASERLAPEDKRQILCCNHLSALEITIAENKGLWNKGKMPYDSACYACVQGSDAHAWGEIGRRSIYIDIPHLSLSGLRLAFEEFQTRIKFPDES